MTLFDLTARAWDRARVLYLLAHESRRERMLRLHRRRRAS